MNEPSPAASIPPGLEPLIRPCADETDTLRAALLRELFAIHKITCVIDVGANRGQTRDFLRARVGFKGLIASFEPNLAAYRDLAAHAKKDRRWLTVQAALGPEAGTGELNVMENDMLSSFFRSRDETVAGASASTIARVIVPIRRLDGVIAGIAKRQKQSRIFLKLDTQGFDLEVMKGLGDRNLPRVPVVQTEMPVTRRMYAAAPTFLQMLGYFMKRGYKPAAFFNVISDKRLRAHEMDGLFVR